MGMGNDFELDLTGLDDFDSVEAGERPAAGWYDTILADHVESQESAGVFQLKFQIQSGPYRGKYLWYTYQEPSSIVNDESKQKTAVSRRRMLASRLGLITTDMLGKPGAKISFDDAVAARPRLIIHNELRKWTDKKTNEPREMLSVAYEGVYPPNHPDIPPDVREEMKLGPARERTKKVAGATTAANGTGAGSADPAKAERTRKAIAGL